MRFSADKLAALPWDVGCMVMESDMGSLANRTEPPHMETIWVIAISPFDAGHDMVHNNKISEPSPLRSTRESLILQSNQPLAAKVYFCS